MSQISFTDLCFSYDGNADNVFNNFSTSFDTSWNLGLVARNGRGKTTLLRLLAGELTPNSGTINMSRGITPVIYPPALDCFSSSAALEIILQRLPETEEWRLLRELSLLKVSPELLERPFVTLSPGEQGKLMLAALFAHEYAYVMLDEPGNHLDIDGKRILTQYLKGKHGFLLVSHERSLLDEVTDHTLALLRSKPELVAGPYHIWAEHRSNIESFERAENLRLSKEITLLNESAKQSGQWAQKGHRDSRKDDGSGVTMGLKEKNRAKAMKLERRAKQTVLQKERAAEERSKLLHDIEESEPLRINPLPFHRDCLIHANKLNLRYGEKILARDATFQVMQGDRLWLSGQNGAGKSTMLRLISGEALPELIVSGELQMPMGLKISVLPQVCELPSMSLTDFISSKGLDITKVLMLLRKLGFPREAFDHSLTELSSGQGRKLMLAISLSSEAHLYIWDEPLNYLDIQSREQIEEALLISKPTLIFTEHDSYFCKKIATEHIHLP